MKLEFRLTEEECAHAIWEWLQENRVKQLSAIDTKDVTIKMIFHLLRNKPHGITAVVETNT